MTCARLNELLEPYALGRQLKQVAKRAGVSQNWLSTRKNGVTAITADDVYLLARGLQCDPCDFYRDADPAPVPSREDREQGTSPIPTPILDAFDQPRRPVDISRGIRFATGWADLIEAQVPEDDAEAEQLEITLLRRLLEVKEQRMANRG